MRKLYKLFFFLLICSLCGNEREIAVLKEALEKDPENGDYMFFLADNYRTEGQYLMAIEWFKASRTKGKGSQPNGTCQYLLGTCYEGLGQWSEALYWYLEAIEENPGFLDPLLNIASYYRQHGDNTLAHIFAKHGSLFLPSRDYRFDHELSIVSFYTRFKEDGYRAASDLLIRKDAPWHIKQQTYQNILFYVQNLKNTRFQPIVIDLPKIVEGEEETYHPMNPSIHKTENGYRLICRTVNYNQKGAKEFWTIDADGHFKTRNFLVEYNKTFQLLSQQEIIEDLPRERLFSCNVLGLEDARIFEMKGSSWFTCTTRDNTLDGVPQISLCKIGSCGNVEQITLLQGPDPYRCEKNWLPFIQDEEFKILYSYHPFTVYKPDIDTGECELDLSYEPTHDFSQFRGSAGPVPFDDGYLVLIHEVVLLPDQSRCYLHRFLSLDRRFFVKQISKPFTFLHQGIEFCGSMTVNHENTHLILPIGIEDRQAYLCFIDIKTVRSLLTHLQPNI